MNLSAPFIVQVPPFRAALLENLKSCSYVFCNESEAAALSGAMEWGCDEKDIPAIAKKIAALGGNLAGLATSKDEAACVKSGHAAAGTIIQQSGCTCPAWDTVAAKFA